MSNGGGITEVDYGARFQRRFRSLTATRRDACARVIAALVRQKVTSGMRVKPILPAKVYYEARISSGDRLVFRIDGSTLYLIDVIQHDDIDRYGRWPKRR